jgi:hypothetical protein
MYDDLVAGATCGVSSQTARRRVERFLASGYITLRCDASSAANRGLREVTLMLNVPAQYVDDAGRYFAAQTNCRLSAQVLGAQNLEVTLWVRDYLEAPAFERELAERAPGSIVISRQAVVRAYTRLGHILDESGRSLSVVTPPPWRHDTPQNATGLPRAAQKHWAARREEEASATGRRRRV